MVKKLIPLIAVFVVGLIVGGVGTAIWAGDLMANVVLNMKRWELTRSFVAADDVVVSESPETIIWVQEDHLKLIEELRLIDYPQQELDRGSVVTHARLAKQWGKLNDTVKRDEHVQQGLKFAKTSGCVAFQNMTSKDDFMDFVNRMDDPSQRQDNSSKKSTK